MSDLVNFIRFTETGLLGNIASMAYDIDLTGEEITSTNPKAPVYRLLARTPKGRSVEIAASGKRSTRPAVTTTPSRSIPDTDASMPISGASRAKTRMI